MRASSKVTIICCGIMKQGKTLKNKRLKNKGKEKTRYFMKCADPFMNTKIGKKSLWNSTNKENYEIIL